MATSIAVIKAQMGTTEYYAGVVSAGELIDNVGVASEMPGWKDLDIEERMQREIDMGRVIRDIVPYLQEDPDRFFGALIVDIYQGWEELSFEPIGELTKLPALYSQEAKRFGFLVLPGERRLIALDGQHRLRALQAAIRGDVEREIEPNPDLSRDQLTVIFLQHGGNDQKIRKIFNKVNRYAKQTGRGDNIITSEDDAVAIITRWLISQDGPLPEALVNWKSNTLAEKSTQFTTISALYETVEIILGDELARKDISKQQRPSDAMLESLYQVAAKVWKAVLHGVDEYMSMLEDPKSIPDRRKMSLLFKPAGQMAMFRGLKKALDSGVSLDEAVRRLNKLTWDPDRLPWKGVLYKPNGNIDAGREAKNLAGRIITYYLTEGQVTDEDVANIIKMYRERIGNATAELPTLQAMHEAA